MKFGALVTPCGFDWDGDGDDDILCGNTAGYVAFIENLAPAHEISLIAFSDQGRGLVDFTRDHDLLRATANGFRGRFAEIDWRRAIEETARAFHGRGERP